MDILKRLSGAARLVYSSGGLLYLKYGTVPGCGRGKEEGPQNMMASMPGFWEIGGGGIFSSWNFLRLFYLIRRGLRCGLWE